MDQGCRNDRGFGTALASAPPGTMEMKGSNHLNPGVRDAIISIVTIAAILALLALMDERIRDQGVRIASGEASHSVAVAARVGSAGWAMVTTAQSLGLEQVSLALFVIVAAVLVVCMLRT